MYFRALLLTGCVALTGCQSPELIEQQTSTSVSQFTQISELTTTKSKLPSAIKVAITKDTQTFKNDLIDSPVAVFEIPANRGQLTLKITSEIKDSVFAPYAIIYDTNGQVLENYGEESFSYYKPKLHLGNRLVADVDFFPPTNLDKVLLVVYTKSEELGEFTDVAHPARLDAEGRGNYMPEMKDIPIPHSLQGTVELDVSGPRFVLFGGSSQDSGTNVVSSDTAKKVKALPDTANYYKDAIASAVAVNDLPKALALLDEAKALNVEGAQEAFIKAVNASK